MRTLEQFVVQDAAFLPFDLHGHPSALDFDEGSGESVNAEFTVLLDDHAEASMAKRRYAAIRFSAEGDLLQPLRNVLAGPVDADWGCHVVPSFRGLNFKTAPRSTEARLSDERNEDR